MSSLLSDEPPPLPLGLATDTGATVHTFVARHQRVRDKQGSVIRGLLDLHRGVHRIVGAVPDLCFAKDVARCQRMLVNTLQAAATAYLALHGRRLDVEIGTAPSLSEQLLAASRETVEQWLTDVAAVRPPQPVQQ